MSEETSLKEDISTLKIKVHLLEIDQQAREADRTLRRQLFVGICMLGGLLYYAYNSVCG